jgi:ribonucleoside-diphosphate reductase beta chain
MGLLDSRAHYFPFEYQQAYDFWKMQQKAFWIVDEINLSQDISNWNNELSNSEKKLIESTLKGFTQVEVVVQNYWNAVSTWFPKAEVSMAAQVMANMETIHQDAYSKFQISLGMNNFDAFLQDPAAKAKIENLVLNQKTLRDKALSLAVFSGFAEGVSLFSSFAILLNFSRHNTLKGLGQIIAFSIRDESLHANYGAWLFNTLKSEYGKSFWDDEFKKSVYEAARASVKLEDDYIDMAFGTSDTIKGLTVHQLKQYIRYRANTRLQDLGLKNNWKNIDNEAVREVTSWFDPMAFLGASELHDFFSMMGSAYSRGVQFEDNIFE